MTDYISSHDAQRALDDVRNRRAQATALGQRVPLAAVAVSAAVTLAGGLALDLPNTRATMPLYAVVAVGGFVASLLIHRSRPVGLRLSAYPLRWWLRQLAVLAGGLAVAIGVYLLDAPLRLTAAIAAVQLYSLVVTVLGNRSARLGAARAA
ncbi:hypothetical protein AB0M36_07325 [Actinoplanes sp. NPDC051346]|uniref:hypothetical protein n=1 Tax=Actinoplanes sp. NPDC051346 TaxID=3155048 RepID=UPI003423FC8C